MHVRSGEGRWKWGKDRIFQVSKRDVREGVITSYSIHYTKLYDIVGIGTSPSTGLRKGVVVNIEQTVQSIKKAISYNFV